LAPGDSPGANVGKQKRGTVFLQSLSATPSRGSVSFFLN
jgi:hypothetical protein